MNGSTRGWSQKRAAQRLRRQPQPAQSVRVLASERFHQERSDAMLASLQRLARLVLMSSRMTTQLHSDAEDLRFVLNRDHARLDALFEQLTAAFNANATAELPQLWTAFESGLTSHLALEERDILPEFARLAPAEAAVLMREHAEIRKQLSQLGIALDLHLTRAEAVAELVRLLRSHAKREDALMYRWAQQQLRGAARSSLLAELRRATRDADPLPAVESHRTDTSSPTRGAMAKP
jgi:hemerythrin-like domain-containing protein